MDHPHRAPVHPRHQHRHPPVGQTSLARVFIVLRVALHTMVVGLTIFVIVRAVTDATLKPATAGIIVAVVFLFTYVAGVWLLHGLGGSPHRGWTIWLAILSAEWIALVLLMPDAAYLLFPLLFLYLEFLPTGWGLIASVAAAIVAIVAIGMHGGFTVGGVVGPLIGTAVAILIGFGYRALASEAAEREWLMTELVATRGELAATERAAGVAAERGRLAREIHDTVSQSLSSIQMLLRAAEREDPDSAGIAHIRLARESAATSLLDTRRIIRELTPPELDEGGLGAALRRLAASQWSATGLLVRVRVSDALKLPIDIETAMLRIAQSAMANVIRHADASVATISIERDDRSARLRISDDGKGFDPAAVAETRPESFGLTAMAERVDQLNGTLTIDAAPGAGTTIMVDLELTA